MGTTAAGAWHSQEHATLAAFTAFNAKYLEREKERRLAAKAEHEQALALAAIQQERRLAQTYADGHPNNPTFVLHHEKNRNSAVDREGSRRKKYKESRRKSSPMALLLHSAKR
jgi:hypothetical protein